MQVFVREKLEISHFFNIRLPWSRRRTIFLNEGLIPLAEHPTDRVTVRPLGDQAFLYRNTLLVANLNRKNPSHAVRITPHRVLSFEIKHDTVS